MSCIDISYICSCHDQSYSGFYIHCRLLLEVQNSTVIYMCKFVYILFRKLIVSVLRRLENLGWKTAAGKAKVFGTILGIGGAMLLTFYKGPVLNLWNTNINLLEITSSHQHHGHTQTNNPHHQSNSQFLIGALLGLVSCICYSLWLIIQVSPLIIIEQ